MRGCAALAEPLLDAVAVADSWSADSADGHVLAGYGVREARHLPTRRAAGPPETSPDDGTPAAPASAAQVVLVTGLRGDGGDATTPSGHRPRTLIDSISDSAESVDTL